MSNKSLWCAVLVSLLGCAPAYADPTAEKLSRIEGETLLLKARERQLDVQGSILMKQNQIATIQAATAAMTHAPVASDPQVRSVEGIGRAVFATLQLGDGTVIEVQPGDMLPKGMQVVSIAPGNVIVRKGRQRVRLARAQSGPVLPLAAAVPGPPPGMPAGAAR
ncbi:type IV pilus biogenesis protein PilP [Massilia rhizosphaerae]|jgi:type IV pilus biogenesis protein PilP|uniref:type IV pilus biogenesis protein PilP n=1 Tax=Massilia rhizosphaerae TaxID=2784389 RepID=UPI0018DC6F29|nr:type IV pilus biogenesis protein PilP [Massilia rhizosphaerae]